MHEKQEVLTTTEARQGSPRRLNFRVLTTSLIFAVIAGALLYALFYRDMAQISPPAPEPAATAPTESAAPPETTPAPAPTPTTPAP